MYSKGNPCYGRYNCTSSRFWEEPRAKPNRPLICTVQLANKKKLFWKVGIYELVAWPLQ
jgi:hypothetical protein